MCTAELNRDRLRVALLARCRRERIEPPGPSRVERILGAAEALAERRFTARTAGRLTPGAVARLGGLIAPGDPDGGAGDGGSFLQELKADPGQPGVETLLGEIGKLERVKAIGLPAGRSVTRSVAVLGDDWTSLWCKSCYLAMPAPAPESK